MSTAPTPTAEQDPSAPVLSVRGLSVGTGSTRLLHDVTFRIQRGERVGLIGESGSGKSLTALAVMGLLGEGLRATGSVTLSGHGSNLLTTSERRLSRIRGHDMAMVFQEPMTALNPTMRVGRQVAEAMTLHRTVPAARARQRAVELLDQVGLPDPAQIARSYPHQLSGGQRQRVVTAIALANDPLLLVCDEPTTALDVTVQALVLDLLVRGVEARDAAMLFITHDLAVVASTCERVLVMYGGRIVEAGPVTEVFASPRHRYTQGLLAASDLERPATAVDGQRVALPTIRGSVPSAGSFPDGCVFRNRCHHATDACAVLPPWSPRDDAHEAEDAGYACVHPAADGEEVAP
ncbi:ABC transporter ATP-binding protein [Ornithinicoccus hortensis]|uniref:Peptide/nickel transport system ATP-binding protein n=1 Tax=Ornithinicoccus hortensis TaxID=82346 RepID=A0A542YND3_9MICO|nr:ABC transporter ATP-binding protein [Ornithinicoccus hortensis]TQL49613.1 peptide/nickel transport system ATP-binding protein [Ornithinicoccus hortensis]